MNLLKNHLREIIALLLLAALLPILAAILQGIPLTKTQAVMTWLLGAATFAVWQWQAILLVSCLFRGDYPKE